jgi:hypothetical protein
VTGRAHFIADVGWSMLRTYETQSEYDIMYVMLHLNVTFVAMHKLIVWHDLN